MHKPAMGFMVFSEQKKKKGEGLVHTAESAERDAAESYVSAASSGNRSSG